MVALDTNLVIRILTRDDPQQLEIALEVLESDVLWLPKTVLLESEWVLRVAYNQGRSEISEAIAKLLGIENLVVEDRQVVLEAHAWFSQGMDFADALHLASSRRAEAFLTFDKNLAKAQKRVGAVPPVQLL